MQIVAIKFTYALDSAGGYWLAMANRTTEYVSHLPANLSLSINARSNWETDQYCRANAGQWQRVGQWDSGMELAWKHWGLV